MYSILKNKLLKKALPPPFPHCQIKKSISSLKLRTLQERKGKKQREGDQEKDGTGANLKNIITALVENYIAKPFFFFF